MTRMIAECMRLPGLLRPGAGFLVVTAHPWYAQRVVAKCNHRREGRGIR